MNQADKQSEISLSLNAKTVTGVNYYLMNRPDYFYPNQPEQLVDCGVELVFSDGSFFSMGMNFTYVAIDSFAVCFEEVIRTYNDKLPFIKTDVSQDERWKPLMGKTIQSTTTQYNWFEDIDEVVHYIPQDIEINFETGEYLAFCATAYTFEEDGISILGPDSEGEILVLFNEEDTKHFKRGKYLND